MTVMVNGMATRAVYQEQTARALIQGFFGTNDHQGLFTIYSGSGPWGGSWIRKTQWVGTSGENHGFSPLIQCGRGFNQQKSGAFDEFRTWWIPGENRGFARNRWFIAGFHMKQASECTSKVGVPTAFMDSWQLLVLARKPSKKSVIQQQLSGHLL